MTILVAVTVVLALAGLAHAQDIAADEARRFLERYVALADAYDVAIADRYAVVKCYWDRSYSIVIGRHADGGLRIVAEHFETQPHSDC